MLRGPRGLVVDQSVIIAVFFGGVCENERYWSFRAFLTLRTNDVQSRFFSPFVFLFPFVTRLLIGVHRQIADLLWLIFSRKFGGRI